MEKLNSDELSQLVGGLPASNGNTGSSSSNINIGAGQTDVFEENIVTACKSIINVTVIQNTNRVAGCMCECNENN